MKLSINQCDTGCLKCISKDQTNNTKICVLCDGINNYYLDNEKCLQANLSNCKMISHSKDTCLECNDGYFQSQGKCVAVEDSKKIQNCKKYDSIQSCQKCNQDYFLSEAKCQTVLQIISNCSEYASLTTCKMCNLNYFVSQDQKKCSSLPEDCLAYSDVKCQECTGNTILDKNYYQNNLFQFDTNTSRNAMHSLLLLQNQNSRMIMHQKVCRQITAKNCLLYEKFDECKSCIAEHYLDKNTKQCKAVPQPMITNCIDYVYHDFQKWDYKCSKCIPGYYLNSDQLQCLKATEPEFCQKWNQSSKQQECVECQIDKILINGTCNTNRQNKAIEHCLVLNKKKDECETCQKDYILNKSKTVCKFQEEHCKTHDVNFDLTTNSLTCLECIDNYYMNDQKKCMIGSMNCQVYETENECKVCKNQFFQPKNCENQHQTISSCSIYSQTNNWRCAQCNQRFFSSVIKTQCYDFDSINNCKTYSSSWSGDDIIRTCTVCNDGFELVGASCSSISTPSNCIRKSNDVCTLCKDEYYLATKQSDSSKHCVKIQKFVQENCKVYPVSGEFTITNQCTECTRDTYQKTEKQCILRENLQYVSTNVPSDLDGIKDCLEIDNTYQCKRCKSTHALSSNTCSTTCDGMLKLVNADGGIECMTQGSGDLAHTQIIHNVNGTNVSVSCKATTLTILDQSNANYSNQNPNFSLNSEEKVYDDLNRQHQNVICKEIPSGGYLNDNQTANLISSITGQPLGKQREIWQETTLNGVATKLYLRVSCGWNKKGIIKKGTDANSLYLNCEDNNSNEFESTVLGGVPAMYSNLFYAHKCVNNKLLTIVYQSTNTAPYNFLKYEPYNFNQNTLILANDTDSKSNIICLDNSTIDNLKIDLKLDANNANVDSSSVNIMLHCGMALLDLAKYNDRTTFNNTYYTLLSTDTNYGNYQSLRCVACKPGYQQTDTKSTNGIRGECTKISNCNVGVAQTMFDGCSQCDDNYALSSTTTGIINFQSCVQIPTSLKNCLAYNRVNSTDLTGKCIYCKKGYSLNLDFYCEIQQAPLCTNNEFQTTYATQTWSGNNQLVYDYQLEKGSGCHQCNDTSYIILNQKTKQCIDSPQLKDSSNYDFSSLIIIDTNTSRQLTNFTDRCIRYNMSNVCIECHTSYILTEDNKYCISKSSSGNRKLDHCQIAEDDKLNCKTCDEGYSLVNNNCVEGKIDHCTQYDRTNNHTSVTCTKCLDTFYLQHLPTTKCVPGKIQNCLQYDSSVEDCSKCKSGYWNLSTTSNSNTKYCLPIVSSMNCQELSFTEQNETINGMTYKFLELVCSTCDKNNSIKKTLSIPQPLCLPLWFDSNCTKNSMEVNVGNNSYSFLCETCTDKTYLNSDFKNQNCLQRSKTYDNCEVNNPQKNECQTCKQNHFLSNLKQECIVFPSGIPACVEYDNDLNCIECFTEYYLSQGKCLKSEKKIPNCNLYGGEGVCKKCNENYFMTNNVTCELQSTSLNCKEWLTKNSCKTCPQNYRLETEFGINKCEKVEITYCSIIDIESGNCKECIRNYYPVQSGQDKGTCQQGATIENCLLLAGKETCEKCIVGFALANDQKSCLVNTTLEKECYGLIVNTPICTICKAGYQFFNGQCLKNTNSTIENGCFHEKNKVCDFCIPGWSMGTDGKCKNNKPETNNNDDKEKSILVFEVIPMILMLLIQLI